MRKRLQLKLMLTASTLLATSCTLNNAAFAAECDGTSRGIATTEEHGRTIYLNDDAPAKERPAAAPQLPRSNLVHWRSKENRWKAVPSAETESGRAARPAAADVHEFYGRDSVQSANAKILQANFHGHQASPEEIDRSIVAATRPNVDPYLVRAVIKVEWNSNSNAISREGARGLTQLMPKTARELNVENPFDPEQNADGGVRHPNYPLEKYNGDGNLTLAAYNAGEAAVGRSAGRSAPCRNPGLRAQDRSSFIFCYGGIDLSRSGASRDPVHVQRDGRGVLYISNTD